ncbi:MAG: hypothetical protein ACREL3_03375 [Gemmatimonadales bacterium]
MSQVTAPSVSHDPGLDTVEMVCERLGEMGLPVGPDTARELVRAVMELEAARVEAHVRDALETSLETIRVATQSAMGVLAATERLPPRNLPSGPPKPVLDPPVNRKTPAQGSRIPAARGPVPKRKAGEQSGERPRPAPEPPRVRDEYDGGEHRPVFRRPRGR